MTLYSLLFTLHKTAKQKQLLPRQLLIIVILLTLFLLPGCLYENPPSQPARQIDTWLAGAWMAQDKSGKIFEAVITPESNTRYHVTFENKDADKKPWEFEGWISRVDNLDFLTLRSLSTDPRYNGKYLFLHYEVIKREKAPYNGIGPERIRITEPHLDEATRSLDSYHLRQAIRENLRKGRLLLPQGSVTWTKVGKVTLSEQEAR